MAVQSPLVKTLLIIQANSLAQIRTVNLTFKIVYKTLRCKKIKTQINTHHAELICMHVDINTVFATRLGSIQSAQLQRLARI